MSRNPLTRNQVNGIFLAGILVVSAITACDFYWMRAHTHLPLWVEALITLPATFVLVFLGICWRLALTKVEAAPLRWRVMPLFVVALCLTIYAMQHASKPLVLVSLYGLSRVHSEHLHFISTEKAHPWIVSNGDHVAEAEHLWSLMNDAVGATVFFSTYLLIYQLLGRYSFHRERLDSKFRVFL